MSLPQLTSALALGQNSKRDLAALFRPVFVIQST
jgi:hypothetical protein